METVIRIHETLEGSMHYGLKILIIDVDRNESLSIVFYVLLCFSMILGDAEYNMMLDGFVWFMLIMYVKILSVPNPDNYSQMGFSY